MDLTLLNFIEKMNVKLTDWAAPHTGSALTESVTVTMVYQKGCRDASKVGLVCVLLGINLTVAKMTKAMVREKRRKPSIRAQFLSV